MPVTSIESKVRPEVPPVQAGVKRSEYDTFIPYTHGAGAVEEHVIELTPDSLSSTTIRLALQINTRQGAEATPKAIPGPSLVGQESSTQLPLSMVKMSEDGVQQFRPLTPYVRELVLANLDLFFSTEVGQQWGDIALLKAGGLNHRLISRVRKETGFQTKSIDVLFETMNKALRGELNPEDFRNYRNPASRPKPPIKGTAQNVTAQRSSRKIPRRRS